MKFSNKITDQWCNNHRDEGFENKG